MRRFTLLPVSALLLLACGTRDDPTQRRLPLSTRGPTVTIVDSVVIAEPDSLPLGEYTSYTARTSRGDLFVGDMSLRKVLHFDTSGRLMGVLGRDGDGPGELRGPTSIGLLPGDTLGTTGRTPVRTLHAGIAYGETSVFASDSGYVVLFPVQPGLFLLNREASR